jgi:hypothetical protein
MVTILSEINSVHTPISCVFKIHFTIILFTYNYDFQVACTLRILNISLMYIYSVIYGSFVLYFL